MITFTIFIGAIAWDEVRATDSSSALKLAQIRYSSHGRDVWVRGPAHYRGA